jgi:hypothetical protein
LDGLQNNECYRHGPFSIGHFLFEEKSARANQILGSPLRVGSTLKGQTTTIAMIEIDPDVSAFTDEQVCSAIEGETREIMEFWQHNSIAWAPADVSEILVNSVLERQSSLASALSIWLKGNSEGELILAWANLGALVEGLMKLFLCVYLHDYQKAERVWTKGKKAPDSHMLNNLQKFFAEKVWTPTQKANWDPWIECIRKRRNSIHAFRKVDLGSFDEWRQQLRMHLMFLRELNGQLPYPE